MCTWSHILLDIAPVNHLHPVELAAERCTCHPVLFRHVRLQWLPDARLQRIDDAVDGSIGLFPEDAPQSKVKGIGTGSKSRRVRCSSARTSASSRARSLALFWTRDDLDEHHLVCIVIARNPRHHDVLQGSPYSAHAQPTLSPYSGHLKSSSNWHHV